MSASSHQVWPTCCSHWIAMSWRPEGGVHCCQQRQGHAEDDGRFRRMMSWDLCQGRRCPAIGPPRPPHARVGGGVACWHGHSSVNVRCARLFCGPLVGGRLLFLSRMRDMTWPKRHTSRCAACPPRPTSCVSVGDWAIGPLVSCDPRKGRAHVSRARVPLPKTSFPRHVPLPWAYLASMFEERR
jgi:hypothetical protein